MEETGAIVPILGANGSKPLAFKNKTGETMARDIKKIDARGRFFLPAKLKEKFGRDLVATISLDQGYLCVYTAENFENIKKQIAKINSLDPVKRILERAVLGEALELTPDSQGRITLTSELWERIGAKPNDEICVIDILDKLEICRKSFYEENRIDLNALVGLDEKYYVEGL